MVWRRARRNCETIWRCGSPAWLTVRISARPSLESTSKTLTAKLRSSPTMAALSRALAIASNSAISWRISSRRTAPRNTRTKPIVASDRVTDIANESTMSRSRCCGVAGWAGSSMPK